MAEFPFYEPERVLRRNLAKNPSFENDTEGWVLGGSGVSSLQMVPTANTVAVGSSSCRFTLSAPDSASPALTWVRQDEPIPVTPGQYLAMSMLVRRGMGAQDELESRPHLAWRQADNTYIMTEYGEIGSLGTHRMDYTPNHAALRVYVTKVPDNAGMVQVGLSFTASGSVVNVVDGDYGFMDAVVIAVADTQSAAEAAVSTYFDGDTPDTDTLSYRYASDGTSEEYIPERNTDQVGGVTDVGIATTARLGLVTDVYSRSREKIKLRLALPDRQLIAGERVELAASAQTASAVTWRWRQITGPTIDLKPKQNTLDFIAPDVDRDTTVRIGVYAGSEDGRNRSDWHYFDLTIQEALARYQEPETGVYRPVSPKFVGYERGPREIWNDVIPPNTFVENPKYEQEIIDLGIVPDDVEFSTVPPARASRGAVYVDPVTGDVYRNFGDGYNETDDTTAAPRKNAYMVNPATGDISKWIED